MTYSKTLYIYIYGLIAVLTLKLSQSCDFGTLRKKLQNGPLNFASVVVLAPQNQKKKHVASHLKCHVSVERVKIDTGGQNCHRCKT